MTYLFAIIGFAVMWAIWKASRPQAQFVVRLTQSQIETTAGKITAAFLDQIHVVAQQNNIRDGEIRGMSVAQRIQLKFSADFPPEAAQQLRNWWVMHGWRGRA